MSNPLLYPKIDSVFKRDPATNMKTFLMGEWTNPTFEYLKDLEWHATEKVDGTNTRIHVSDGTTDGPSFEFGGRTENSQMSTDLFDVLVEVGNKAVNLNLQGLTLFGEGYGKGIQSGGIYRDDVGFILFDVMVTADGYFLEHENVVDIASKLDIPVTPIVYIGTLGQAIWQFEAHRPTSLRSTLTGQDNSEGWVLRPARELRDRRGERVITKVKVRDFPHA